MRICTEHWEVCKTAVDSRGLMVLSSVDGKEAIDRLTEELEGAPAKETFDPLMSMNNHWWSTALKLGGLYMMGQPEDGRNEGHYCPICEIRDHYQGFDATKEIEAVADQMRLWAIDEKLLPEPS